MGRSESSDRVLVIDQRWKCCADIWNIGEKNRNVQPNFAATRRQSAFQNDIAQSRTWLAGRHIFCKLRISKRRQSILLTKHSGNTNKALTRLFEITRLSACEIENSTHPCCRGNFIICISLKFAHRTIEFVHLCLKCWTFQSLVRVVSRRTLGILRLPRFVFIIDALALAFNCIDLPIARTHEFDPSLLRLIRVKIIQRLICARHDSVICRSPICSNHLIRKSRRNFFGDLRLCRRVVIRRHTIPCFVECCDARDKLPRCSTDRSFFKIEDHCINIIFVILLPHWLHRHRRLRKIASVIRFGHFFDPTIVAATTQEHDRNDRDRKNQT